jgi:GNAT superfamily N-acetyltransferase
MEVEVRTGVLADFDECMRLAMSASAENAVTPPSPLKIAEPIYGVLSKQIPGIIGVIGEVGGRLEGAILLNIGEMWYSREPVIEERAIFVDPEFRSAKGGRARKLAEFAKRVSDEVGLPLSIGVLSNTRTAAKMRLYERVFGAPAGVYFLYGAKTGMTGET